MNNDPNINDHNFNPNPNTDPNPNTNIGNENSCNNGNNENSEIYTEPPALTPREIAAGVLADDTPEVRESKIKKCIAANGAKVRKAFSVLGFALAIILAVTYATQYLIIGVMAAIDRELTQTLLNKMWFQIILSSVTMYIFGMGSAYLFLTALKKFAPPAKLEKKKLTFGKWLIILIISFGAMYTGNIIGTVFTGIVSTLLGKTVENPLVSMLNNMPLGLIALQVVILAPIIEELVFRKLLVDRMYPYGEKAAIIISALFFGLFHGNFSQFFYAFMLGIILSFVYLRTGNILYTIAIHMTINFCGSLVPMLMTKLVDLEKISAMDKEYIFSHIVPVLAYLAYTLFIYAVWIAGVVLFFVFLKKYKLNKVPLERDGLLPASNERMGLCCVNAGMIVSFVFCLYLMVTSLL